MDGYRSRDRRLVQTDMLEAMLGAAVNGAVVLKGLTAGALGLMLSTVSSTRRQGDDCLKHLQKCVAFLVHENGAHLHHLPSRYKGPAPVAG